MSLLTGIKTLFQRVGVPAHEIEAHLRDAPVPMSAEPVQDRPQTDGEPVHNEANPVPQPEVLDALPDEHARFAALEAELVRLRAEAQHTQQDREAAQFAADAQTIEGWVRGLKMTPAEAEAWREIARDKPAAFAAIVPVLDTRPPLPQLAGSTVRASETADADRLETLTRQRMKEKGMDHTAAFKEVCAENRELALSVRMKSQEGN